MKFLNKLACTAALALSFANANAAVNSAVMNDWVFNPNGGGFASGHKINEYLDVNGNAFIQLTPNGTGSFTFVEHAVFNITQADSKAALFPVKYAGGNISAVFQASGTGTFNGAFAFTGGTITMYQNPVDGEYGSTAGVYGANLGTEIAKFNVLAGGGGLVDASGRPTGNGQVSVLASADVGAIKAGYFFDGKGKDLSTESILSFAFTNANNVARPDAVLVSELVCEFSGFKGKGCTKGTYANKPGEYFLFSNNGQFKLATEVPEPGSLALFGIAMLGAGVVARKRANTA